MSDNERFSPEVMELLRKAGWYPGRSVGDLALEAWRKDRLISDELDMPRAARVVLEEFGGLVITSTDRGIDFARLALNFDPSEGDGGQFLRNYADAVGVEALYPLGVYGDNDGTFLIDASGAVYVDFRLDAPAGSCIDEALERLLLGIRW